MKKLKLFVGFNLFCKKCTQITLFTEDGYCHCCGIHIDNNRSIQDD